MELLIRVVDRASDDPARHAHLTKAGDVIAWHEDGADWGREERVNPHWRVVRVPGLAVAEAESLVAPELPRGPAAHEFILRSRGMTVDLAAIGLGRLPGDRTFPDLVVDAGTFRAAMSVKGPVPHPDLLGPPTPHTIG